MRTEVSIIIPVFNQLQYTKGCIDSLLRDTQRVPYEIIVIDNASTDGTREYLETKSRDLDRTRDCLIPIFNEKNLGVAPAWNQGLKAAKGDYLAVLNNDILVTPGWLRSLLWAMDLHRIDLISPFAATGPLTYELEERAARFTKRNLSILWNEYDFCAFVMPRSTYNKIGLFDEGFLIGGYEDTDYCYRVRKAGLRYGVSGASFIHHFGSSTLGEFKKRGDKHASHNKDYFMKKWGEDPSASVNLWSTKVRRSWRRWNLKWDRM